MEPPPPPTGDGGGGGRGGRESRRPGPPGGVWEVRRRGQRQRAVNVKADGADAVCAGSSVELCGCRGGGGGESKCDGRPDRGKRTEKTKKGQADELMGEYNCCGRRPAGAPSAAGKQVTKGPGKHGKEKTRQRPVSSVFAAPKRAARPQRVRLPRVPAIPTPVTEHKNSKKEKAYLDRARGHRPAPRDARAEFGEAHAQRRGARRVPPLLSRPRAWAGGVPPPLRG